MTWETYADLLTELGYNPGYFDRGRLLRHDLNRRLPRVYFNRRRDGLVYFTAVHCERQHFPEGLWLRIAAQQSADDHPRYMTVVPRRGLERAAFADLSDRQLARIATYRS